MSDLPLRVEAVTPPFVGWDDAVRPLEGAGLFHRAAWFDLWKRIYGQDGTGLLATEGSRVVGALPLVRRSHPVFGRYWLSMPFFDHAGPVGRPDALRPLAEAALALCRARGDRYVELRLAGPRPDWPWTADTHKEHVVLDLPAKVDALLMAIPSKQRSQVRRAEREEAEVRLGGAELLPDFLELYGEKMHELGSPAHGPALFRAVLEAFPAESTLVILRQKGELAGVALLLVDGDTTVIPWAAARTRLNHLSPNMALYAACMRWAIERGTRRFDFGRGDAGSTQLKFKLQWGGKASPLHWYRAWSDGGDHPVVGAKQSPAFQLAARVWTRLPPEVTRALGPHLVRWF